MAELALVTLSACSQGCYSRLAGSISPARRDSLKIKRDSARSAITITQLFQKERSRDKPKSLLLQQHSGVLWLQEKRIIRTEQTERLFAISNNVLQVKQSHDRDSVTVCYLYFWDYTPFVKP